MDSKTNKFPILPTGYRGRRVEESVPLYMIKPHEKQALINHGQDLETLAGRGGLTWYELWCVLSDNKLFGHDMNKDYKSLCLEIFEEETKLDNMSLEEARDILTTFINSSGSKIVTKAVEIAVDTLNDKINYINHCSSRGNEKIQYYENTFF